LGTKIRIAYFFGYARLQKQATHMHNGVTPVQRFSQIFEIVGCSRDR